MRDERTITKNSASSAAGILKAEFRNKRQLVLNLPLLYLLGNSQGKWIKVKKLTQLNSFANFLTKSAETTWCELEIKIVSANMSGGIWI